MVCEEVVGKCVWSEGVGSVWVSVLWSVGVLSGYGVSVW